MLKRSMERVGHMQALNPQSDGAPIDIEDHQLRCRTHNTYTVFFYDETIHTIVTHDSTIVSRWISDVESSYRFRHRLVGLDVEWRPRFTPGRYPVALLQLCVGSRCLVYQILHSNHVPDLLAKFLADDRNTFVGVGVGQDLKKLAEDYGVGADARTLELGTLAADVYDRRELKNSGLKALSSLVLEKEMEKPKRVTMSRWDNRWLTLNQVKYACVDAFVSFEIARVLNNASSRGAS